MWPFVGIPSFLRAPICTNVDELDAAIAVIGVPTDEGSPFMAGSRFGPRALREHSLRFAMGHGYYDPETSEEYLVPEMAHGMIADVGDAEIWPTDVKQTFDNISSLVRRVLDRGALPIILGGDHSITYPVARVFTEPMHIVHFDAHNDYAPFIHDLRFTNGHAFRHLSPMPHVKNLIQAGIRSLRHGRDWIEDSIVDGNRIVTMNEFHEIGPKGLAALVPEGENCYVSIDIDVLDISLVPGCVSAEPNGMAYAELRDTLTAIAERTRIVGFDFVEVNPQLDVGTGVTAYLGAHTVIEFLGRICAQPWWAERREAWLAERGKAT
ncbi:MAG: arginase [Alphaproteobacteria bacterium]|nr:arginase [Alphaproteobacteria bacterium]